MFFTIFHYNFELVMVDMSQQHRHLQEEERSNLIPV
jgi:hypothetical protein